MAVKTLTNQEVIDLLPSVDVMATLEKMFGALGRGEALQPTQVQTVFPAGRGDFINYSGVWMSAGVYGIKTSPYIVKEKGYIVTAWTLLLSTETGEPLLLVDGSRLTLERTAATTALAVRYLAKTSAKRLAIIGSGAQALAHLRYVAGLRDWESIRVWSLNSAQLTQAQKESFIEAGQGKVAFTETKAGALKEADVILLCTSAADAVVSEADFIGTPLITSISTNATNAHEIDPALLSKMAVFCDCTAATATVAGEMRLAAQAGTWSPEEVVGDLGDLVNGRVHCPEDKPVFFRSIGQGLEDIAIALAVWEKSKEFEN